MEVGDLLDRIVASIELGHGELELAVALLFIVLGSRVMMSLMRKTTLLAKSNMRLSILNDMGVIIPDPNTMKSNDMAS